MTLGQRFLKFVAPTNESMRQEMRHSMAMIEAHTDDLTRTVSLNGDQIRAAIERFRNLDPEQTVPNGH